MNPAVRVGINGFGRMGRLALRAGRGRERLALVHVNEVEGGPRTGGHLLERGLVGLGVVARSLESR